jgi:hypothetical protein
MCYYGGMKIRVRFMLSLLSLGLLGATSNPYATLTPDQTALLKPAVERYVRDQEKQDWADLWEIQDQTSDVKNELLLGRRDAPDMNKKEFVSAMKYMIGTGGYPRLRSFELMEVRVDKGNFIMIGCGKATRESWSGTGYVTAGIRVVDGKPKFDIWSMTSDSCSK